METPIVFVDFGRNTSDNGIERKDIFIKKYTAKGEMIFS